MTKKNRSTKRTRISEVDYDVFWKKFIEEDFEEFMDFGFSKLHCAIDYDKGVEFFPKELQKIMASYGKKGTKTSDLLIKVFLKPAYTESGETEEVWILVHIEIEISPGVNFASRMFTYFYRALDKYEKKVIALAVFPGKKPQPHHKFFEWKRFGTEVRYKFTSLDAHQWTEEELLKEKSIVALALLACRRAVKTRNNYELRYTYKRELLELIRERNYPIEKARRLFIFVFYLMYIPEKLDRKIAEDIFEQNKKGMLLTQIPPEVLKRGDVFFEVWIEKTTGKPYAEYVKEQEQIKAQLNRYEHQLKQAARDKQKAAEEKQLLEQKAAEEKQLLEQKAAEEKQLLEQKAAEEKQLLEQKAAEEQKNMIIELSKLLSPFDIASVLKVKEEDIVKIVSEHEKP